MNSLVHNFDDPSTDQAHKRIPCDFAYPAIAVGKILKLDHSLPELSERVIEEHEINDEIEKFESSRLQTIEQLNHHIKEADQQLPPEHAKQIKDMLEFQIDECRENGSIYNAILTQIREHRKPAETAIHFSLHEKVKRLDQNLNLENRNAAKGDDYISIGNQMVRNVLELPQPSLEDISEDKIILIDSLSAAEAIYLYNKRPKGLILASGSSSGHVGDLCAGFHIPCAFLPPASKIFKKLRTDDRVVMDGLEGEILIKPKKSIRARYKEAKEIIQRRNKSLEPLRHEEDITKNGQKINLLGTIGVSTEARLIANLGAKGIGLFRTEASLIAGNLPPERDEQVCIYNRVFKSACREGEEENKLPIVVRTYDLEADKKPTRHLSIEEKFQLLAIQFEALFIAADKNINPIKVMIPNIRTFEELERTRELFNKTHRQSEWNIKQPELGMMVEVPTMVRHLDKAKNMVDFLSIGTNDLPARMLGAERDNPHHQAYIDVTSPEVLDVFAEIIGTAQNQNLPLSLCGGPASNEFYTPLWMGMGADTLCVRHGSMLETRNAVINTATDEAHSLYGAICDMNNAQERQRTMLEFNNERNIGPTALMKSNTPALELMS